MLLAYHQEKNKSVLEGIQKCANKMASLSKDSTMWQSRSAWAMDQIAGELNRDSAWVRVANKSIKKASENEKIYISAAKLKLLQLELQDFTAIRFTKTNERPEANIGKKTKALELLESHAQAILANGTAKQIVITKNILKSAYLDFAEAMETAALPSKLTDAEKEELKKSFMSFAQEFKTKATAFDSIATNDETRALASTAEDIAMPGKLSGEESDWLKEGKVNENIAGEIYAKKALALYKEGKFGEARYFAHKWKQRIPVGKPGYDSVSLNHMEQLLSEKIPELDPMQADF